MRYGEIKTLCAHRLPFAARCPGGEQVVMESHTFTLYKYNNSRAFRETGSPGRSFTTHAVNEVEQGMIQALDPCQRRYLVWFLRRGLRVTPAAGVSKHA